MSDRLLTQRELDGIDKIAIDGDLVPYLQAQDAKTANYYETIAIPALYEKWSQESINVRKATAKELIEEIITQFQENCHTPRCKFEGRFCQVNHRCQWLEQLKQRRGK